MNQRLHFTASALTAYLHRIFPQTAQQYTVEHLAPMSAELRLGVTEAHLRPGGTVSGPAMFSLADCAFYAATLAMIGPEPLTVTTHCAIDFMRKPPQQDLICRAQILKLGQHLVVGDALIFGEGSMAKPVARASLTYARPRADH